MTTEFEKKLRAELNDGPIESKRRDLRERIAVLKAQLRGGPLTDGRYPTAEGHIASAVTLLTKELDGL